MSAIYINKWIIDVNTEVSSYNESYKFSYNASISYKETSILNFIL